MTSLENDPIRNLPLVTEPRRDRRAATWQVLLTAFGLIAIVTVFFWGINNQRDETAGEQTAATTPTPVTPQGGDTQQGQDQGQQQAQQPRQPSSTTGQGGGDDKSNEKDQSQKVN